MNKKLILASLIATALFGALFSTLGSNMFFADIGNFAANFEHNPLLVTFPALTFAALFPVLFLYIIRFYLRPKTFKRLTRLYVIIALCLSGIGFITSLLAGFVFYKSFVKPYPFPGYLIIFMILHLAVLAGGVYGLLKLKKVPEDEEKYQVKVGYVFKTMGWFLFVCLVFNRIGMFFVSPIYIQWRTFYMTFPFYLYLLFPGCLGALKVLIMLGYLDSRKMKIILSSVAIGVNLALFLTVALIGMNNTAFISAVSPAMPLERLASKPVEILIHVLSYTAVGVILLVQAIKAKEVKE